MKPICPTCRRFFKVEKLGVYFVEQVPKNGTAPRPGLADNDLWKPFKIWAGDLYKCEGCGAQMICADKRPLIHHNEATFAKTMINVRPEFFVNDC